jgi:orotate phosphoribosyltransferase
MNTANHTPDKMANYLLKIKAVKLSPAKPFTWASGLKSPIYCDNRVTLSHPEVRTFIAQSFADEINNKFKNCDVIAGVATGGIAHGALVAEKLGLPFVYVRSEPKKHGLSNLVEGEVKSGQSVVVIEDLISTGGSSLKAVIALREAGCEVKGMSAIFTYGFSQAENNFKNANCNLFTITNYLRLIEAALAENYITNAEMATLRQWRENPTLWSENFVTNTTNK